MSNRPEQEVPQDGFAREPQRRPLLPASLIVLLIILALAVAAYFWDQSARSNCQESFDALNKAMSDQEVKEGLNYYRQDVAQHMQGSYERKEDEAGNEVYVWTAIFGLRSYCIRVEYQGPRVSKRLLNPDQ